MPDNAENKEEMEIDEVELTLRRFAMSNNDQQLTKLLNSMFPKGIAREDGGEESDDESNGD